jgi:hemerythrin-like domain-containing protein
MERVLSLIRLQVDSLRHTADKPNLYLLGNAVRYMQAFPSQVHDAIEELLYLRLVERQPAAAPMCSKISKQRRTFAKMQSELSRNIDQAQTGDSHALVMLKHSGVVYCLEYADHIRLEEYGVLPKAERAFGIADWQTLSQEADKSSHRGDYPELRRSDNLYDFLMSTDFNSKSYRPLDQHL